jgi:type III secretion protein R
MSATPFDPIAVAMLLAVLSLLPLALICTTCFLKVSMVLVIVRNAIGVQQVPPSIAVYAVALATTLFIMAPVLSEIKDSLPGGFSTERARVLSPDDLVRAAEPLRRFMLANTTPERRTRVLAMAQAQWPPALRDKVAASDYVVLIPTFVISELELGFQIGFILYVPFVVIDLLLSNLLLALGMQMVSPMVISLPLKMLLFVLLDGWTRLFEALIHSYA